MRGSIKCLEACSNNRTGIDANDMISKTFVLFFALYSVARVQSKLKWKQELKIVQPLGFFYLVPLSQRPEEDIGIATRTRRCERSIRAIVHIIRHANLNKPSPGLLPFLYARSIEIGHSRLILDSRVYHF